jgi:hypothetical protein
VESLNLLVHLGAESPEMLERLSLVLGEPQCPDELRKALLSFLVEQNYPGLAKHVVPSLAQADQDPALRDSILEWLMRNPSPEVLAEVVKLWADEPSPTGVNEPRYRNIVERMAGKPWDEALFAGINARASFPRGRALEILAVRLPAREVKSRILQKSSHKRIVAVRLVDSWDE